MEWMRIPSHPFHYSIFISYAAHSGTLKSESHSSLKSIRGFIDLDFLFWDDVSHITLLKQHAESNLNLSVRRLDVPLLMFLRRIFARHVAEADAKAVPGVDCGDSQGQIGQFCFSKMLAHLLKHLVGNMID